MPRLKPASPLHAGIALALVLGATASRAGEPVVLEPLSLAKPDAGVRERIRAFEAGTRKPATGLLSFFGPSGQAIYLVIAPCCDHLNRLYDAEGRFICAPSGGFGGAGDGQCPDWAREEERWRRFRLPESTAQQPWPPR